MNFIYKIRRILVDGLIILLPIGLTSYLIWFGYRAVNHYMGQNTYIGKQVSHGLQQLFGVEWIPGLSIIYTALLILLLGQLSRLYFGQLVQSYLDKLIKRVPLVNKIYTPAQEIVHAIWDDEGLSSFKEPVLIQYPREGVYTLGFVTKRLEDRAAVYVFSTPDPVTGNVMLMPEEDLIPVDLSVEEAFRWVISMGISASEAVENKLDQSSVHKE